MHDTRRTRLVAYGVGVLAVAVTLLIRTLLRPVLGDAVPTMFFFPAVVIGAYCGGLWPGLLTTLLSALIANSFLIVAHPLPPDGASAPTGAHPLSPNGTSAPTVSLALFVLTGVIISGLSESRLRSQRRVAANERRYAVTLASIGDAVIASDTQTRVTFLNPAAEALTGWPLADAIGRPLGEVFRIVNEQTRQPLVTATSDQWRVTSRFLAHHPPLVTRHSVLLARDGRETPVDDCGAPIVDDRGAVMGVVLVFRDASQRRQAEEAEAFRRAHERMALAVRGSHVGVWDIDMPDGDYRHGRRHYLNIWEQFGFECPLEGWRHGVAEPPQDDPARFAWTAAVASRPPWETGGVQIHPDDADRLGEAIGRYLAGETAEYETEARFRCQDGSYRTMLARGAAVRDASGKPVRFAGTLLDITRLKRTEEALRESELRWRGKNVALREIV
jgi:PAS domain S-box-containing protein